MIERVSQLFAASHDEEPAPPSNASHPQTPLSASRSAGLKALYDQHWARLLAYVRRAFGEGPPDPEDAVQYAFAQFAVLADAEQVENPKGYLYRSASNFMLEYKRRNKVRSRFEASPEAQYLYGGSDEITAERIISAKERAAIIEGVIRAMRPRYRDALIANRIHGMPFSAIAKLHDCSESEARRRVLVSVGECERALSAADRQRRVVADEKKGRRK